MRLDHKSFQVKELTEDDGGGEGVFRGYASTWERDMYDDVIVKGAFANTLSADYPDGGAHIPIHWQHKDGSPFDVIGETLSAVEDEHGLLVTARLDTSIPEGQRAYELLKRGLIHQMSIGFVAQKTAFVEDEESKSPWDGYREIREIKLFEISLVQLAANQGAEVLEVKAGRRAGKTDRETLRGIIAQLTEMAGPDDTEDDKPKDEPDTDKPASEPADEPAPTATGDDTADDDKPSDDTTDDTTDKPDDESDKPRDESDKKSFDPQSWAAEFQYISDFFSLADIR
ncbi:HK97 family phage prohead protease [Bifidobacterium platyrrhinorum]|uniref:HK97 family phage prohead protease n=1 Tax=Bifidobacterium platyrrhinorum TaxID=2661628 RepID=A0A6L9SU83_9BIFI|nr:HK97 family phage prohead protease [Bifidobacterium platyrrhinorum]NEG56140.1 HK97 family phage prohead protease [Bifidobacterium platyrrhinorum]